MMDFTGFAAIGMIVMMVIMCGGMIVGAGWAVLRGRNRHENESEEI
jgi:hypothetical protein